MKSRSPQPQTPWHIATLCGVALMSGCTVSNQEAPPLAGPSGFGLSVRLTAAPQVLPRDGNSMSTITVAAFNPDGTPRANQRLALSADFGTLSATDAQTGSNGSLTVTYVAPDLNQSMGQFATIVAVPLEAGDAANANSVSTNRGSVRIEVTGPAVPVADFSDDSPAAILEIVTFNASATKVGGSACLSACTYAWTFGDGSSGKDLVAQHQFSTPGVFNVTLTATTASGTSASVTKPVVISLPTLTTPLFSSGPCLSGAAKCMTLSDISTPADGVTIASRVWDFGDGTSPATTTDPILDHTFPTNPNAMTYNVRLRLTDNFGRVSSVTQQVQVP